MLNEEVTGQQKQEVNDWEVRDQKIKRVLNQKVLGQQGYDLS